MPVYRILIVPFWGELGSFSTSCEIVRMPVAFGFQFENSAAKVRKTVEPALPTITVGIVVLFRQPFPHHLKSVPQ